VTEKIPKQTKFESGNPINYVLVNEHLPA
jgi:hypothetical protein